MGKILEYIKLHFSIWVKEPVYKPEFTPIKEWRKKAKPTKKDKDGFVIVDKVRIDVGDTVNYTTPFFTSINNFSSTWCISTICNTGICYPNYFKDYLDETSSNPKQTY